MCIIFFFVPSVCVHKVNLAFWLEYFFWNMQQKITVDHDLKIGGNLQFYCNFSLKQVLGAQNNKWFEFFKVRERENEWEYNYATDCNVNIRISSNTPCTLIFCLFKIKLMIVFTQLKAACLQIDLCSLTHHSDTRSTMHIVIPANCSYLCT
jgi:hypothetical protein